MNPKTKEQILEEALKKFAPNAYEPLVRTIMKHPDTDAITYNQFCEAINIKEKDFGTEIVDVLEDIDLGLMFTDIKDKEGKKFELSDEFMDLFGTFWTIHLKPLLKQKLGIK